MPKKCDGCSLEFRGFGPTCPDCRKKGTEAVGRRLSTSGTSPNKGGGSPGSHLAGDGSPSSKWGSFGANTSRCVKCDKVAYVMERISVEGEVFHPTCFRCTRCEGKLSASDFAKSDGKYYCKPHFAELFMVKGRYEFGNA